ncbi:hypothetical protein [Pseudolactococcus paracarnosus]|uniref:DUF975 family protein n=1 Tax=Pseudolactococcus paracarnosus TaxID=2749962 RepID=A0ABT0AKP3_9LACT|nr:hypothetical protein [Lactococcus paracarnosus]MCJ1977034.1 hypothetical protein [Lactococcus paracarnosus]MCJ1983070.1 hypothetical protein [Lactococcus paracarnosus]MCJ1997167.1 hypothetical protein [Lactococcus paracarnosus]
MTRRLFCASFEESRIISPNLFSKERPFYYDLGLSDSNRFYKRLFLVIPSLFLIIPSYGFGGFLPKYVVTHSVSDDDYNFMSVDIYQAIGSFEFVRFILIFIITIFFVVSIINIFPKKNYMIQRIFGITILLTLLLLVDFSLMPMLLGTTLGATGWLGFSVICLYGLVFFINTVQSSVKKIKQELYGELIEDNTPLVAKIWQRLKQFWLVLSVLLVLNILIFRIGMWGSFSVWRFAWLFAGPIYFGMLTLFICGPMKLYISTFYFAKYSEQYRVLWRVSDEQWYGKRKAKKLAKKQLQQEKRGK